MGTHGLHVEKTLKTSLQQHAEDGSRVALVAAAFAMPITTAGTNILFALAVLLFFCSGHLWEKYAPVLRNPVAIMALALFSLFLLGMLYSGAEWSDRLFMLRKYSKLLYIPLLMPILLDPTWRKAAFNSFIIAMLVTLILVYFKANNVGLPDWIPIKDGVGSVFKNHIQTSFLMSFATFILAHYAFTPGFCKTNMGKLIAGILFACATYHILFLSMGRSGYVVFSCLTALFFYHRFGWKGILYSLLYLAFLAWLAMHFSAPFKERVAQTSHNVRTYEKGTTKTSVGQRFTFSMNTLKLIKEHPFFGGGTGSYKKEYKERFEKEGEIITDNPYNDFLNVMVQLGIPGALLLAGLYLVQIYYSFKLNAELKFLAQGVLVTIMVGGLANTWLMDTTEGHFFAYFSALCFATLKYPWSLRRPAR